MSTTATSEDMPKGWLAFIGKVLALPKMKIDRERFLRANLAPHCTSEQIEEAIASSPCEAGVPIEVLDRLSDSVRKLHVTRAASISFVASLPPGWWLAATIPADVLQFYGQALIIAQKTAYIYCWPNLDDVDDEAKYVLTLMLGVMVGARAAEKGLAAIGKHLSAIVERSQRSGFIKQTVYNFLKVGTAGVSKGSFARSVAKIVPVIGALVSAGLTATMLSKMATRLKNQLRKRISSEVN